MEPTTFEQTIKHQSTQLVLENAMDTSDELPVVNEEDTAPLGPKFQGDLLIFPKHHACSLPSTASVGPPSPYFLNLFTDASFPKGKYCPGASNPSQPAGAAVFWKPWPCLGTDQWHSRAFQILACPDFRTAELFAVVTALETAVLLSCLLPELRLVTVFTDCQDSIRRLMAAEQDASDQLIKRAVDVSFELDAKGVRALVRWCPGHVGIEGNEKADALAKEVRYYNFRHLVPKKQPDSMTGYEISEEFLQKARRHEWAGFKPKTADNPDRREESPTYGNAGRTEQRNEVPHKGDGLSQPSSEPLRTTEVKPPKNLKRSSSGVNENKRRRRLVRKYFKNNTFLPRDNEGNFTGYAAAFMRFITQKRVPPQLPGPQETYSTDLRTSQALTARATQDDEYSYASLASILKCIEIDRRQQAAVLVSDEPNRKPYGFNEDQVESRCKREARRMVGRLCQLVRWNKGGTFTRMIARVAEVIFTAARTSSPKGARESAQEDERRLREQNWQEGESSDASPHGREETVSHERSETVRRSPSPDETM